MKLNNDMRCLIETLFNRVIDFNEQSKISEVMLNVHREGIYLQYDFDTWCNSETGIWGNTEKHLKDMIQWLDEKLAIEQKGEIDPKAEAQRELDKEQM